MNINTFQNEVINTLKHNDNILNEDIHVNKYFGEISQLANYTHPSDGKPNLLIEYEKEKPLKNSTTRSKHTFNIYIAHISSLTNKNSTQYKEIYSVFQDIDKKLSFKSFAGSEPIRMAKTRKKFDDISEQGYLTIYKKRFTCVSSIK